MGVIRRSTAVMAGVVALVVASAAQAQEVNFTVQTSGCFYFAGGSCTPHSPTFVYDASNPDNELRFTGGTWSATTIADQLSVNGSAGVNFGQFDAKGILPDLASADVMFDLLLTFYDPAVLTGNGLFTAAVTGQLAANGSNVVIKYNPASIFGSVTRTFAYDAGTFDVTVNNVAVALGTSYGQGFIDVHPTPEPATLMLMGTGLAGLIPAYRRRRSRPQ